MAVATKVKRKSKAKLKVNLDVLLALPKRQRKRIADALYESVLSPLPLSDAWKAELERRAAASDAEPSSVVAMSWEELEARLKADAKARS